jgi:VCBS repeat protein
MNRSLRSVLPLAVLAMLTTDATASDASGQGVLRLDVPVLDVGTSATLSLAGPSSARYALVASIHMARLRTRAGMWCINPARRFVVLRDSVRGSDAPLDASGRASVSLTVPATRLASRVGVQAVARDHTAPSGWVLSSFESRVVGNGSVGDFTRSSFDLPNSDLMLSRSCCCFLDADGDGDLDAIVGNSWYPSRLFINDGSGHFTDGTFGPTTGLPVEHLSLTKIAPGDVDGDGDLDLYFACGCCGAGLPGYDRLYLNDGHGLFTDGSAGVDTGLPHVFGTADSQGVTRDVDLADVDGDGDLDAFLTDNGDHGTGRLLVNVNGRGLFVDTSRDGGPWFPRDLTGQEARASVVGDLDGDGDPDIVMMGFNVHHLYINQGGGVFVDGTHGETTGLPNLDAVLGGDVELADLDQDGDLDLAIAVDGGFTRFYDRILINDGHARFHDGTFGPDTSLPDVMDISQAVLVGDVDRDGDPDLVFCVVSYLWGDLTRLYLNDGHGRFVDSTFGPTARLLGLSELATDGAFGDVDGDGDLDLLLIREHGITGSTPVTIYFDE